MIEALPVRQLAAGDNASARRGRTLDQRCDVLVLARRGQETDFGRHVQWTANPDPLGLLLGEGEKLVLNASLYNQTRVGHTVQSRGGEHSCHLGVRCTLKIGIGENDERRFAAELKRCRSQVLDRIADDMLRCFRSPGEGHVGDLRMSSERGATRRVEPDDDIDDAWREASLVTIKFSLRLGSRKYQVAHPLYVPSSQEDR